MNRRNFLGSLLAIGAGFTILPGAGRVWVPSREIVKAEVQSIWQTHRLSYDPVPYGPFPAPEVGSIKKMGHMLFYGSKYGWLQLIPMSRPLNWKAGEHKNWNPSVFI